MNCSLSCLSRTVWHGKVPIKYDYAFFDSAANDRECIVLRVLFEFKRILPTYVME